MTAKANSIIPAERIQQCIYLVRQQKVMLDSDLASQEELTTGYRLLPFLSPVPWHFSLACPARTAHNALQWSTPDEAATNELEPVVGRTDV